MPYCKKCHNTRLFGSSKVLPASPSANGPVSGLLGDFDPQGRLIGITRLGADNKTARSAQKDPEWFFDVCQQCGDRAVEWEGQPSNE